MMIPTVHLNGTGKQTLLDDYDAAFDALDTAFNKLKQTAPNGRDYYVQGNEALQQAAEEHIGRLCQIQAVMDDLQQLMQGVYDQ